MAPASAHEPSRPDDDVTDMRLQAAAALRRLGHAFVAHQADDTTLARIAALADEITPSLERRPRRNRSAWLRERATAFFADPPPTEPAARTGAEGLQDRAVAGAANPTSVAITCDREGDEAVATVEFGPAFEGAPARVHGGIVAAVFDDVTGYLLPILGTLAFTGQLTVTFHDPVPTEQPIRFRARCTSHRGRRLNITATAHHNDELLATAAAIYITVDPAHFARHAAR